MWFNIRLQQSTKARRATFSTIRLSAFPFQSNEIGRFQRSSLGEYLVRWYQSNKKLDIGGNFEIFDLVAVMV